MISVKEARKYLDEETNKELSDEQVQKLIDSLYDFADLVLDIHFDQKALK